MCIRDRLQKAQRPKRLRGGSASEQMQQGYDANRKPGFGGRAIDRLRKKPKGADDSGAAPGDDATS